MTDTLELNFSGEKRFGDVEFANVRFNDFVTFCASRRVLALNVKTGFYRVEYRQLEGAPRYQPPADNPIVFSDADFENS